MTSKWKQNINMRSAELPGSTKSTKEHYHRTLSRTIFEKLPSILRENKDNFAFKNTPILPIQGHFSKNTPICAKQGHHVWTLIIDPFLIPHATSIPLGKGTNFALHHRKMLTTKRRAIQILHISTFQFTFKCGYNDFISKYKDINSLHVTQINLLHNNTCCSTKFTRFRCKKGSLHVNSVMILVFLSTNAEPGPRNSVLTAYTDSDAQQHPRSRSTLERWVTCFPLVSSGQFMQFHVTCCLQPRLLTNNIARKVDHVLALLLFINASHALYSWD